MRKNSRLSKLLRPVVIVPESKRVDRMLKEFRSERFHMAIVVDEFRCGIRFGDHRRYSRTNCG